VPVTGKQSPCGCQAHRPVREIRLMRTYEQDYYGWIEDTSKAIGEGRWNDIDRELLADEVLDLGNRERDRLESAMRVLLRHLLKLAYRPEKRTPSWDASIRVRRKHAAKYLLKTPEPPSSIAGVAGGCL
jgi:hypothetical protein